MKEITGPSEMLTIKATGLFWVKAKAEPTDDVRR